MQCSSFRANVSMFLTSRRQFSFTRNKTIATFSGRSCHDRIWRLICANKWTSREAKVVCRQLGYRTVKQLDPVDLRKWRKAGNYTDTVGRRKMWLDHVWCSGEERKLLQCTYDNGRYPMERAFIYSPNRNCSANGEIVGAVCAGK